MIFGLTTGTKRRSHSMLNGRVLWITGLSGAGKSTLALEAFTRLRSKNGNGVVRLDGDELRDVFGAADINTRSHGREARLALAMQYAYLCRIIATQGLTVVVATISMFKEVYAWNRAHLPGYFEVYLKVPIEELRRRDPKNIYRRFDAGRLSNVAGLDLPVDEPGEAHWVAEFTPGQTIEVLADNLMAVFDRKIT